MPKRIFFSDLLHLQKSFHLHERFILGQKLHLQLGAMRNCGVISVGDWNAKIRFYQQSGKNQGHDGRGIENLT